MAVKSETGFVLDGIFYSAPGRRILRGIYLKALPGEVCVLIGRNGSGKSTLLRIGAGQMDPAAGIVLIDGQRFHKTSRYRRYAHLAYLPQKSMLPDDMSVERLISAFPNGSVFGEDEVLEGMLEKRIDQLSRGMRRYLELRLVLSLDRAYVLLDEPFTGIEPLLIERITGLLNLAKAEGKGILLTDQYHRHVLPIADRLYLMVDGTCSLLRADKCFHDQLVDHGYLRARRT